MGETPAFVRDILRFTTGLQTYDQPDEGLVYGNCGAPVKKLMVCWMVTQEALRYAVEQGVDTVITHEAVFFPKDAYTAGNCLDFLSWKCNRERCQLMDQGHISVIRAHMSVDYFCIFDDFAALLGLGSPIVEEPGLVKVYDGKGLSFGEYVKRVKGAFGLEKVRATPCDPQKPMWRIGLPWGGLGLSNNSRYMEKLVEQDCDLFLAGETDNYGLQFAVDSGVAMIEIGHEISENPGLRHFAGIVQEKFPQIQVIFHEVGPAFTLQ